MQRIISNIPMPRFRLGNAAKEMLVYGLSLLFVILFLYTVYHKVVAFEAFKNGIRQIPYVGTSSVELAWGVLGAEAVVALLLIWPDTNRLGLWGALALMVAFTGYIGAMLLFAERLPCHCGGAIEKLTWGQHLLFNCGFIALAAGLLLYHYKVNLKYKILNIMATISSKIKKAIFGMMMAALTIGFSAFTAKESQHLQRRYWVNNGTQYEQSLGAVDPTADCEFDETEPACVLISDNDSEMIPTPLDYEDVSLYSSLEEHEDASSGIYDPNP
ncbi:MauE/DoxX family redox-associated membrane protein [Parapedobacter sp. DT-150]|uniref:MauE/DoxX family redox-associated membrane protein n=1 Tax=Parapedobacter sp. DT-150 TaxID=3396162 RepID=UPI003F1A7A3C